MGKDFISLKKNGASEKQIIDVYNRLKQKEVVEASEESYFYRKFPVNNLIEDIEVGDGFTKESVIRLKDGGFIAVNGIVKISTILKNR